MCFNSTLVRLKDLAAKYGRPDDEELFQFHSGSIKRRPVKLLPNLIRVFQFHSGSIKSEPRLQQIVEVKEFQFHSGSIKSSHGGQGVPVRFMFQFHSGSIKRSTAGCTNCGECVVSIPLWFD